MTDARAGDWNGLIVYCAGTSWDGTRGTDQHVAERLSRRAPVLFVDPPESFVSRRDGVRFDAGALTSRLRVLGPNLARLTPAVLPARTRWPVRAVTSTLVRRAIRRAVGQLGAVDTVIAATALPVFDVCNERQKVFFVTDDWSAGAELMGLSPSWIARREQWSFARADLTIAVSEPLARVLRARGAKKIEVVENGVDVDHFARTDAAPPPSDVVVPTPAAGLIGHLSARIDLDLLDVTAAAGIPLLLVGPRSDVFDADRFDALVSRPNVQWVGAKTFDELPSYMHAIGVGLVPYRNTEFNRSSFPLKVLEYLAAGRPVVATDLPAMRQLEGVVRVESDPSAYATAVRELLDTPPDVRAVSLRTSIAGQRSWDVVTTRIAELIGLSGRVNEER